MDTLPEARIAHATQERLRLRIPGQRGNTAFFDKVSREIAAKSDATEVRCNSITGSVLCVSASIDVNAIAEAGRTGNLFHLPPEQAKRSPISDRIGGALKETDKDIRRFTSGELDLSSLVFVSLLGVGAYQLLRGNFAAPPWYTAFWYAFGVFTKTVADGFHEKKS